MSNVPKTRACLNFSARNIPETLRVAKAVYTGISGSPTLFPSPPVAMALFNDQIQVVEAAELTVNNTRATGSAATRSDKVDVLVTSLNLTKGYVQGLCNGSPEQASTLIAAAGMQVAKRAVRNKPLLAAKQGTTGEMLLVVNRTLLVGRTSKHVVFNWESSVDGGKTWVGAPPTGVANTAISGFTPLTMVSFRVSATISKAQGDWCPFITALVH